MSLVIIYWTCRTTHSLEHVNELIGDKVQEYAEGMIQGKKKKSSGMFGMFSKK